MRGCYRDAAKKSGMWQAGDSVSPSGPVSAQCQHRGEALWVPRVWENIQSALLPCAAPENAHRGKAVRV